MSRFSSLSTLTLAVCLPGLASAQFFTLDQATGTTGGEIGYSHVSFEKTPEASSRLIRGFAEYATAQTGERWSGYLSFASTSVTAGAGFGSQSVDGVLGVELGAAYTSAGSPTNAVTFRGGLTVPRDGGREAFTAAGLTLPARLTDFMLLVPETSALRLAVSGHGRTPSLVYRIDGGLDVPIGGDLGEDLDTLFRLNAALGLLAGPATIGLELANLVNLEEYGDDAILHTLSAGVRGDFSGIQPGIALTFPLDEDLSDLFSTVLQFSVRASLP